MESCTSYPEFSAIALGIISNASANEDTPNLARPSALSKLSRRYFAQPTLYAPAPGTTTPLSIAFFTVPSQTCFLRAITASTTLLTTDRSADICDSRCSAVLTIQQEGVPIDNHMVEMQALKHRLGIDT